MRTTKAQQGQTALDVALAECGALEAAWDVAALNGLALTDALVAGTDVIVPQWPQNPVAAFYKANGISSATLSTGSDWLAEGIGAWEIGFDFIIS